MTAHATQMPEIESRDGIWQRLAKPGPLAAVVRPHLRLLPLVAILGLVASAFEGIGIGALIPLTALLFVESRPEMTNHSLQRLSDWACDLPQHTAILGFGGAILLFMLFKGLFQWLNNRLIAHLYARLAKDLTDALANRIVTLDYDVILRCHASRLVTILSEDSWTTAELFRTMLNSITAVVALAVFASLLLWLNWALFLIVLIGGLLILAALLGLFEAQGRISLATMRQNRTLGQRMLEIITGARTIRIYNRQDAEQERFASVSAGVFDGIFRIEDLRGRIGPGLDLMLAAVFIAIVLAAYAMRTPLPELIAFLVLVSRAQPQANLLFGARGEIAARQGAVSEVKWLLGQIGAPSAVAAPPVWVAFDQPIRFEAVSYQYPDGGAALDHCSFSIEPGQSTALIGNSGAGKTTIVNLLARLVEPGSGSLYLGSAPLAGIDPRAWRQRLAVAGQDTQLFDGSIAHNIAIGRPEASRRDVEEAAEAAGAREFIAQLTGGFETMVGENGARLSGGQRQRIGLARALIKQADLLILDEAINAVDALSECEIMDMISERRLFRSLLLISHRPGPLARCSHGIVLERGRVIETGPVADLDRYRAIRAGAR